MSKAGSQNTKILVEVPIRAILDFGDLYHFKFDNHFFWKFAENDN